MSVPPTAAETVDPLESHVELSPEDIANHTHRLVTATLEEFPIQEWEKSPNDDLEEVLADEEDVYGRRVLTRDFVRDTLRSTDITEGLRRIHKKLGDNVGLQPLDDAQHLIVSKKVSTAANRLDYRRLRKLHSDIGEAIEEASKQDVLKSSIILLQALHQQYFGVRVNDLIQIMQEHGIGTPLLMQCIEATNALSLGYKAAKICVRNGIVIVGSKNDDIIIPQQKTSAKEHHEREEERQLQEAIAHMKEGSVKRKILEYLMAQPGRQIPKAEFEQWYFKECNNFSSSPAVSLANLKISLSTISDIVIISDPTDGGSEKYKRASTKESDILKLRLSPENLRYDLPKKELKYIDAIEPLTLPDEDPEQQKPAASEPLAAAAPALTHTLATEVDIKFLIGDIHEHKKTPGTTKAFLQIFLDAIRAGRSVKREDLNSVHAELKIKYAFTHSLSNFAQFLKSRGYKLLETIPGHKNLSEPVPKGDSTNIGTHTLTIVRATASGGSVPYTPPPPAPGASPSTLDSIADMAEAVAKLEAENGELRQKLEEGQASLRRAQDEISTFSQQLKVADEAIEALRSLLETAKASSQKAPEQSRFLEAKVARLISSLNTYRTALEAVREAALHNQACYNIAEGVVKDLGAQKRQLTEALEAANEQIKQLTAELREAAEKAKAKQAELHTANDEKRDADQALNEARLKIVELEIALKRKEPADIPLLRREIDDLRRQLSDRGEAVSNTAELVDIVLEREAEGEAALRQEIASLQKQLAEARGSQPAEAKGSQPAGAPTQSQAPLHIADTVLVIKTQNALRATLLRLQEKYLNGKDKVHIKDIIELCLELELVRKITQNPDLQPQLTELRSELGAIIMCSEKTSFIEGKDLTKLRDDFVLEEEDEQPANAREPADTDESVEAVDDDEDSGDDNGDVTILIGDDGTQRRVREKSPDDDDDDNDGAVTTKPTRPTRTRKHSRLAPEEGIRKPQPATPPPSAATISSIAAAARRLVEEDVATTARSIRPIPTPSAAPDTPPPPKPPIPYSLPDIETAFTTIPALSRSLSTLRTSVSSRPTVSGTEALMILRMARVFESKGQETVTKALKRFHEKCDQKITEVEALILTDEKGSQCRIPTRLLVQLLDWRF